MNIKTLIAVAITGLFSATSYAALYAPKNYTCTMESDKCVCTQQESLLYPLNHTLDSQFCKESGPTKYQFAQIFMHFTPTKFIPTIYMNAEDSTKPAFSIATSVLNVVPDMSAPNNWIGGSYYSCKSDGNPELCPMNISS